MGLFGKSEKELKDYANQLESLTTELDNRESDVKREEAKIRCDREALDAERATWEKNAAQLAAEKAEFEKRRQELARREMEAKAGFAKEQEAAFREVVETRQAALDARQRQLDELAAGIAVRLAQANEKEGQLAKRELEVTEREQLAAAGFADKASTLAAEAKRQHEANLAEAARLEEREKRLAEESARLETGKEALRQREEAVAKAERERDAGFADIRSALDRELDARRTEFQREDADKRSGLQKMLAEREAKLLADLDAEIEGLRTRRLEELEAALGQRRTSLVDEAETEARRIRETVRAEREAWNAERSATEAELKARREENEKKAGELSAREDHMQGVQREFECQERLLETRREKLDDEVESRVAECKATLGAENKRLLESLRIQSGQLGAFKQMEAQFNGKDPAEVLRDLNAKMEELSRLREELATRPTEEMRERYDALERERDREKERADEFAAKAGEANDLRLKNAELEELNKSLKNRAELWEAANNEAQAELHRLRSAYERPAEAEARCKAIESPRIPKDKIGEPPVLDKGIDELTWLQGIGNACDNYGLHFPQRILKAFHTSLKNAEWSPITILAGVSGTGKSQLPRLYAHFGGLFFEQLSVSPNWDSQESMLGFFNSIDNKFDAQPVLRFLAQSQKPWSKDYPGLQDALCLVLLDEMNLAHPELYFSEFLSKLESRRGLDGKIVPTLEVKIGAGLDPYQLPLGRNVLWAGTMNQDETTHSLSDKVLDRSTVIFFPRPIALERRVKLKSQNDKRRGPLLHKDTFLDWCTKESPFTDEQVKPFKEFVEEMNGYLGVAGRAIGHRVWQSLEYYMANYPDVRAALKDGGEHEIKNAMHVAFEDQLVQKIMPKLRGIDTRGKSKTECLDKIQKQLATGGKLEPFENLLGDFDLACELGHGQFIWQSANYLNAEKDFQAPAGVPETSPDVPETEAPPASKPKRKQKPRPPEDEV